MRVDAQSLTLAACLLAASVCGLRKKDATAQPHPCVGFADGGYRYRVTVRLVDSASDESICCSAVDLKGELDADAPGFPATGRSVTDSGGVLQAELTTGMACGTCMRDDGTIDPPPEPPELNRLSIVLEGTANAVEIALLAVSQERVVSGERWLELGTVHILEHPHRRCDESQGYCPIPPERLRHDADP